MAEESLYAELGVPQGASFGEIKAVYQSVSPSWEAAGQGDDEWKNRFRRLACAYAVLSDPGLRRQYDETPGEIDLAKRIAHRVRESSGGLP
ncbi:MAG TPA: DnaJ domain-containing protein, partial [Burkholderiales bacterium]|nr:DnaJ domain-containing protein [Burkholderiales bacterium]